MFGDVDREVGDPECITDEHNRAESDKDVEQDIALRRFPTCGFQLSSGGDWYIQPKERKETEEVETRGHQEGGAETRESHDLGAEQGAYYEAQRKAGANRRIHEPGLRFFIADHDVVQGRKRLAHGDGACAQKHGTHRE